MLRNSCCTEYVPHEDRQRFVQLLQRVHVTVAGTPGNVFLRDLV